MFKQGIGEWGPRFNEWRGQVVVNQEGDKVSWSPVHLRDGKIYIDSTKLRNIRNINTSDAGADGAGLVALDAVLDLVRQAQARRERRSI